MLNAMKKRKSITTHDKKIKGKLNLYPFKANYLQSYTALHFVPSYY